MQDSVSTKNKRPFQIVKRFTGKKTFIMLWTEPLVTTESVKVETGEMAQGVKPCPASVRTQFESPAPLLESGKWGISRSRQASKQSRKLSLIMWRARTGHPRCPDLYSHHGTYKSALTHTHIEIFKKEKKM